MGIRKTRRKCLKRLSALAGAAVVPGVAVEDVLAIPITTAGATTKKKKTSVKKKAAPKKKKATVKKKAATRKKKVVARRKVLPYEYQPYTDLTPPRGVPEPSTAGLVSIGVAAIALAKRHKKKGQERKH